MTEKYICLCRVRCQRKSLSVLLRLITSTLSEDKPFEPSEDPLYQFCVYTGDDITASDWGKVLELTFGLKNFVHDILWKKTDKAKFRRSDDKHVICELVINDEDDLSNIQYLLLAIHTLLHNGIPCTVLVSRGRSDSNRYTPLENADYFRLSHLMYFYSLSSQEARELPDIYNRFFICTRNNSDNRRYHWIKLPKTYSKEVHFGRIIPQIPITHQSYRALVSLYDSEPHNEWFVLFRSLCEGYYNKLSGVFADNRSAIREYMDSDSYFETTLFLALCCYISEEPQSATGMDKQDIDSIHETCMNFAQGILQLVDNVVSHVLGIHDSDGCGILTVRFRKADDAKRLYLADPDEFQGVDYFLELYLTDVQYGDFLGIVDKFKDNVKRRRNRYSNEPARRMVHAKFYLSQNTERADMLIEQEEPQCLRRDLREYLENTVCSDVSLKDFFGEGTCKPFLDYISAAENIAFHYGLPILNSVVLLQNGYLRVQSGSGENNIFDNVRKGSPYRGIDDLFWDRGTAFMVYIPLKSRKPIGEFDSLVPIKNDTDSLYRPNTFSPIPFSRSVTGKEALAFALKDQIKNCFDACESETQIGVIECTQTVRFLNVPRLDAYEIIVKAIFLYLADASAKIDYLALTNINLAYDVIKLFRLFALFFDRAGRNELLSRDKSLFLVDCEGKVDILFYGNDLKSIRDSLSVSRLYGGTAEDAVRIIRHLLEGRHE